MKILLKNLKGKDRRSGIKKKKRSIWAMQFQESGKGFLTLSLVGSVMNLAAPNIHGV